MPTLEVQLPRLHGGQEQVKREAKRFNVLACGRRWGKSTLGEDRATEPVLQGYPVAWVAPTYKMLSEAWRHLVEILGPVQKRHQESEHRLETITGGVLEGWSLDNADAIRGRAYRRVILDEAASAANLEVAWTHVIRPTLTDYEGDAWFLSTPKGLNYFWQLYQRGDDPLRGEWAAWQRMTSENPHIPASEVEAARRELPADVFSQEYEAQFLEGVGQVFRGVITAATAEPQERALPGHIYVIGCDWAKMQDFTVFAVVDVVLGSCVWVERMAQVDYAIQVQRLEALCARFKPQIVVPERNAHEPLVEQLSRIGLPVKPFQTTAQSKRDMIEALALALENGHLTVIPDRVLVGELQAYRGEMLPSGQIRYGAPEGMHDDSVMALALAWVEGRKYPKMTVLEWRKQEGRELRKAQRDYDPADRRKIQRQVGVAGY